MNRTTWLALCAEFGPIILFFIAGKYSNFFTAVALFMGATVLAVIFSWFLDKRIPWVPILSAIFVVIGGSLTLWFNHPDAIIVADTIFYVFVSSVIGYSIMKNRPLLRSMFGTIFGMNETGWKKLTFRWFIFLIMCAVANEISRHFLTPDQWIQYRLYKTIALTIFASYQLTLTKQYRLPEITSRWGIVNSTKFVK